LESWKNDLSPKKFLNFREAQKSARIPPQTPPAGGKSAEAGRILSPRQIVSPCRVHFNHLDFARNSFELCPTNTASQDFSSSWKPPRFARRKPPKNLKKCRLELYFGQKRAFRIFID
jgi:hypothetical protein